MDITSVAGEFYSPAALVDVVREQCDAPLDWEALRDEAAHFGSAQAFIDRVVRAAEE